MAYGDIKVNTAIWTLRKKYIKGGLSENGGFILSGAGEKVSVNGDIATPANVKLL